MTWLLDGNILAALIVTGHDDHQRAEAWFQSSAVKQFATCAVTEGTLLRLYLRLTAGATPSLAWSLLERLQQDSRHEFWDDGFSYRHVDNRHIQGHRQVTDAWLAELARRHGAKLATMDKGLAADHADVAFLIS